MGKTSSKPIDYTIATDSEKVCPLCFDKIQYVGNINYCPCGWEGKRGELITKLVEYKVKAYRSVSYV